MCFSPSETNFLKKDLLKYMFVYIVQKKRKKKANELSSFVQKKSVTASKKCNILSCEKKILSCVDNYMNILDTEN